MATTTLRCGMRVPKPRVTVQQIQGIWCVLVDGIENSEHKSKQMAQAEAKRLRQSLQDD